MSKPPAATAVKKAANPATKAKAQSAAERTPMVFALGDVLRCRLTGAEGIAVAYTEYLYGCRRWSLQPAAMKDGKPAEWVSFDEPQLGRVSTSTAAAAPLRATGGPRPDPATR